MAAAPSVSIPGSVLTLLRFYGQHLFFPEMILINSCHELHVLTRTTGANVPHENMNDSFLLFRMVFVCDPLQAMASPGQP